MPPRVVLDGVDAKVLKTFQAVREPSGILADSIVDEETFKEALGTWKAQVNPILQIKEAVRGNAAELKTKLAAEIRRHSKETDKQKRYAERESAEKQRKEQAIRGMALQPADATSPEVKTNTLFDMDLAGLSEEVVTYEDDCAFDAGVVAGGKPYMIKKAGRMAAAIEKEAQIAEQSFGICRFCFSYGSVNFGRDET